MVSADQVDEYVTVVDRRRVSPPAGSVNSPTTLALTYFDVLWLTTTPVRQLFFYEFSCGTTEDFRDSHLTLLERSLSLALTIFYPFAGRLVPSTDSCPVDRVIRFSHGDSVPLLLAESTADLARLVGSQPKRIEEFHSLLPELKHEKQELPPLVAFQITVFPRRGISVGITVRHVVADGFGCTHFIKSWASIFKAGGDVSVVEKLPVYDPNFVVGAELEHLKRKWLETETQKEEKEEADRVDPNSTKIAGLGHFSRTTFYLTRPQIQKLRDRVSLARDGPRISSFTLTCAYVWVCLAKSRDMPKDKDSIGNKTAPRPFHFGFAVDCRPRLDPPVPDSYARNCIGSGLTEASYAELTGENGLVVATDTIRAEGRRLEKGLLQRTDYAFRKWGQVAKYRALSVAGTPRFGVYDTDFGWGRPCKVEIISIELNEAISLAESRDDEGGVEIGLVGPPEEISRFTSFFEEGLKMNKGAT